MSDDPIRPGDDIPLATPVAALAEARPISQPAYGYGALGPMYLAGTRAAAVWQDLGVFLLAAASSMILMSVLAGIVLAISPGLDERILTTALIPVQAAIVTGVIAVLLRARRQSATSVGLTRHRLPLNVVLGLVVTGAAFAVFGLGNLLLYLVWRDGWETLQQNENAIMDMLPPMHPALMGVLMAIVGFYEELVFRGFLLTRLRRIMGSWIPAVIGSSLLFAVPHAMTQETAVVFPLFGLGVVFSVFTIWRKSLIPAMIGHTLFDSAVLMFMYFAHPDWS